MSVDKLEILITKEEIQRSVVALGERISSDYNGEELVLVGILKGGFVFLADLARKIKIPLEIDFISVSSYGNSTISSGIVRINKDIDIDIANKHVLLVEDIVDTGLTLGYLKNLFFTRGPKSVKICTAFDKPIRREIDINIEYKGIEVPNRFVVGYGLDYKGKYRNLPNICTLD